MNKPNDCQNRREAIVALVLGELEAQTAEELVKHIDTCESCRLLYQALKEEEETIQSTFKAIDSRSKIVGDALVAQAKESGKETTSEPINFHAIRERSQSLRKIARLAAAAIVIIAVLIGILQISTPAVAWSQIVERFRSVPFFSTVIYIREDAASEPKQMELWMSRMGKVRLRIGRQVVFGNRGEIAGAFDLETHARTKADEHSAVLLRKIGEAEEFSLDAIIRIMFGGAMQDVTPLVNPDAVISQDMVVFDVEWPGRSEWARIWALRESRLPVRIRVWSPRDGYSTDAVFEYSREQADEFFDPNAFENILGTDRAGNRVNLAYAFLKDPGGKMITPEDMFARTGYHVPQVRQVGITPEGAVWITAGKGRNLAPNGNVFDGFSRIEDDLGRTYFLVGGGNRSKDDTSFEIFVPSDFPFDNRRPNKIKLFCEVENHNPNTKPELIGAIELTQWKQNTPCPDFFGADYVSMLNLKISLAYKLFGLENAERLDRLSRTIPEWTDQPNNKSLLFFRMHLAHKKGNDEEVVKIGRALAALIFEKPLRESRYGFSEYLVALARTGRIDEAAELFRKISSIEEMSPEKSDERYYPHFVQYVAEILAGEAGLTPGQISKILGFDISGRKEYVAILEQAKRTAANQKAQEAAERRRREISDYYHTHPLPDQMELLKRTGNEGVYLIGVPNTVPGHEDYKFLPINYPVHSLVSTLRYYGNIQPYGLVGIRIEDNAAEQELFADLIYKDGITPRERAEYVLGLFGMELVIEDAGPRKVLVARYDGRALKDCKDVKAPFPYEARKKPRAGMMTSMTIGGFTMKDCLHDLAIQQNRNIEQDDKKLVIFDETGIESSISSEKALWPGEEGLKLAKKWFEERFGVTFTEETRQMKTCVIRKRQ